MKRAMIRLFTLLLLAGMLVSVIIGCRQEAKQLLTLSANGEEYTFSVNCCELLMTRIKGTLVASGARSDNGHAATENGFWESISSFDGGTLKTMDEYYREQVLERCKFYLAAEALFDEYRLSLTDADRETVEDLLNELILTDGDGSKTRLNSILSEYSVNYDILSDLYTTEAKIERLRLHLYGLLNDSVKQDYLESHYYHFEELVLPSVLPVYETDENGDTVYYNKSTGEPLYRETAYFVTIEGNKVYYTDDTYAHISYNTEQGGTAVKLDDNGNYVTVEMTDAEKAELKRHAEDLLSSMEGCDLDTFRTMLDEERTVLKQSTAQYTDGFYLDHTLTYTGSMKQIVDALAEMENGDVRLVEGASGSICLLYRYACTEGAYEKEENLALFSSFQDDLSEVVLADRCRNYVDAVKVDGEILATLPSMKDLPSGNYGYY